MNFWDCIPEYCLTKKVTAKSRSTLIEDEELELIKSNISVSGSTPVIIYSFVPAVSGTLLVRLGYEHRSANLQYFDNDTCIKNINSSEYYNEIISITRGHRYDIKFIYNDGLTGTIYKVLIGGVISDDLSMFISDITE